MVAMTRCALLVGLAVWFFAVSGLAQDLTTPVEQGKQLFFKQGCYGCHTEGATDQGASPVDLSGQAWTGHAWHHPDSVLVQMIAEGIDRRTGVMPPFGHLLRPDEVRTLIAVIKTFWTPAQQQFQPERTQRADVEAPLR